jgi:hypothetical protein
LQADGIQAEVEVRFAVFRAAEKMRDAQVDLLVAQLARFLYDSGIINMDKMAQMCGQEKADQTEPRQMAKSDPASVQNALVENPEPGDNRVFKVPNEQVKRQIEAIFAQNNVNVGKFLVMENKNG